MQQQQQPHEEKEKNDKSIYWKGAVIGAFVGAACGFFLKRKIIASAFLGAFTGGYTAMQIQRAKAKGKETGIKNIKRIKRA